MGNIEQKLNCYLKQMLESADSLDKVRYSKLNREYSELMRELEASEIWDRYNLLRNCFANYFMSPETSEARDELLSEVRKFLSNVKNESFSFG